MATPAAATRPALTPEHAGPPRHGAALRGARARRRMPRRWDEAGEFPRELYRARRGRGPARLALPRGVRRLPDADCLHSLILCVELAQCGAGGVLASLMSHAIAAPPIAALGSRRAAAAHAAARSWPASGSPHWRSPNRPAAPTSRPCAPTARREGDVYVVNGEKTFITSGMRADVYTVAVRTDPQARGARGISLLLVERDTPGFTRTPLQKMGWWASDTAHLTFDGARVPVANLLGAEGEGFRAIMHNFNAERFSHGGVRARVSRGSATSRRWRGRSSARRSASAWSTTRSCGIASSTCSRGSRRRGVARGRGVAARSRGRVDPAVIAAVCMAKNTATRTMQFCADAAVQTLGGMGYMRGTQVRAHLSRGQGQHDRRRGGRNHERPGRAPARAVSARRRAAGTAAQACRPADADGSRRRQLLRASARLFREKGYDGTSVRDIAQATGMQSGSWVYHFADQAGHPRGRHGGGPGRRAGAHRGDRAQDPARRATSSSDSCARISRRCWRRARTSFPVVLYEWRSLEPAARRRIKVLLKRYEAIWRK